MLAYERMVARINACAYLADEPITGSGEKIMAKQVKLKKNAEFTFSASKGGMSAKYPWDEWFNGDLLLLERSVEKDDGQGGQVKDADGNIVFSEKKDYEVAKEMMVPKLKTAARRRYKVVQTSRKDADGNRLVNALIIRARDMDTDERTAEDLLRAEEKDAKKAEAEGNGQPTSTAPAIPMTEQVAQ